MLEEDKSPDVFLLFQIAALKCQMDNDAHTIEKLSGEKSLLQGQIGELHARIRTLEGQVSNKKLLHRPCC